MTGAYIALSSGLVVGKNLDSADETDSTLRLSDERVECVAVSPDAADRIIAGTFQSGLWKSSDGGETFRRVGESIEQRAVTAVGISSHDPNVIWAGTEPSRVYRSIDGGDTWNQIKGIADLPSADEWFYPPRPDTHHVRWIESSPGDAATWYIGIEAGAFVVTRDNGETWTERPPDSRRDNHTIATHPDRPERVYAAAGDGYAESTDAGRSWYHPQSGLDHRYCWGLAVDPGNPDVVLITAARGAREAHRNGPSFLYRKQPERTDVEPGDSHPMVGSWERLDDEDFPTGDGVRRGVVTSGSDPGSIYGAWDRGLYRTSDAGDTWENCDITLSHSNADRHWSGNPGPVLDLAVVE